MNLIVCNICSKIFNNELELSRHKQKNHDHLFLVRDLNSSLPVPPKNRIDHFTFPLKRRSIFDGVDVSGLFKKRKLESRITEDRVINVENGKLILNFACKFCELSFRKLGLFKKHNQEHHQNRTIVSNIKSNSVESKECFRKKSASLSSSSNHQPKPNDKLIKTSIACDNCSLVYNIHQEYLKPFSPSLQKKLLEEMPFHFSKYKGFARISSKLPAIRPRSFLKLGNDDFLVMELKGEGGYAKVFSATWRSGEDSRTESVLKIQKPANDWEWYILNQLQERLQNLYHQELGQGDLWMKGFMSSTNCYTFDDGSVIVSEHQKFGTLLDMINITSTAEKDITEPLAIHVLIEILGLVELLHTMDFVHADIKPDNIMISEIPGPSVVNSIQIIDFGKTLDLRAFPSEVVFDDIVETSGLNCVEMREKRAWCHHIDYFGLAAVAYCLLFGQYMEISKVRGRWVPKGTFKRWWKTEIWKRFFDEFLNLSGIDKSCLPSLIGWRQEFLNLFERENMTRSLTKARDLLQRKCNLQRRRTL